ncbi:MAG TPA: sulfotransferase [Kiritimatiellia bacterium]|nr:sulfotransferase [Kiritimatiellia bacterium]
MSKPNPFLALGAGRGGTSLLGACLSGNSRIAMAMELFGCSHLLGYAMAHQGSDIFSDRTKAFRDGCLNEIQKNRGRIWGNKLTTEQLFGLEDHNALNTPYTDVLNRFLCETVPEFNVVFIMRDGRACVESKVRRTGQTWEQAAYRWHYSVRVLKAVQAMGRPACIIKFENLVANPRATLDPVCDYLGVDFEPAMLRQTESEIILPEYRAGNFNTAKLKVPEIPDHAFAFIKSDLEYCGYI